MDGLAQPLPSRAVIEAADCALRPAQDQPGATNRAAALLRSVYATFPPSDGGEPEGLRLSQAWTLDAVLDRPMWAIEAGLRALTLRSRFRPVPVEILDAIDAERERLAAPYASARVRLAEAARQEADKRDQEPPSPEAKARVAALARQIRIAPDEGEE